MASDESRRDALRFARPDERTVQTQQTAGMRREAGVCPTTTGSVNIWSGLVTTPPGTRSGAHHHGPAESAIYVVSGRARFSWGEQLGESRIAEAGDFVYVPPYA
ncbi:MAG: cupin domain-containing protein, partial [Candidatus Limnocylindrales bacterium]